MSIWPPIVMLCLYFATLLDDITKWGEPKKAARHGWADILGVVIGAAVLYWGGFFDPLLVRP